MATVGMFFCLCVMLVLCQYSRARWL